MSTGNHFLRGLAEMRLHPVAQICTLMAVSMVTLLAAVGLLILSNIESEVLRSQGQARFQVYWRPGVDPAAVEAQWADLKRTPGVVEVSTFTSRAALAELMRGLAPHAAMPAAALAPRPDDVPTSAPTSTPTSAAPNAAPNAAQEGQNASEAAPAPDASKSAPQPAPQSADDFAWLEGENPLPATALISFAIPQGEDPEPWMGRMYARLHKMDDVERVTYNPTQLSLATGWIALGRKAALPAMAFFAVVVGLVVGNTMKLMMLARKDEVEILTLVGARPWYIRAPLMAGGMVQGFLGGVLSLVCLKFVQVWLRAALDVPPLFLKVEFLPLWQAVALVFATTVVGGLASFLAARR